MKKGVKKLILLSMSALLLILYLPSFGANADENTVSYNIPEISMTIDVPSSASLITSAVKKSDPMFNNGTFDYIDTMSKIRDDNALLYGRDVKNNYDIEVMSTPNKDHIKSFSKLSEKKLEKELGSYSEQDDIVSSSLYTNGYLTFFYSSRTVNNSSGRYFYSDYYTVYNGSDITIRIISSNDNLKENELAVLKAMADSIRFPEKRKFSFSSMKGKGVLITFAVIIVLFVLVIVYRKHEEPVNNFIIDKVSKLKATEKTKPETSENSSPELRTDEAENEVPEDNSSASESEATEEFDDDDLSSIDLDEAIAAFDESLGKGH